MKRWLNNAIVYVIGVLVFSVLCGVEHGIEGGIVCLLMSGELKANEH